MRNETGTTRMISVCMQALLLIVGVPSVGGATTYVSGTYNSPVTWTVSGSPYVIQSTLTVLANASLTIEPGVIVKFGATNNSDRLIINQNATLTVAGSA